MSPASTIDNSPVWFITGCSTGLGAALATHVHNSSHRLVATARTVSSLSFLPNSHPNILLLPLDVTSKPTISAAFAAAIVKFGRVDIVVNNAGFGLLGDAEMTTEEESRGVMETNFWGSVNVSLKAVECMREHGVGRGGVVVQISSFLGWMGMQGNAFYSARFVLAPSSPLEIFLLIHLHLPLSPSLPPIYYT
jgi:NADP-dependent 3-hydroxy acid dehydrogenase YdfG